MALLVVVMVPVCVQRDVNCKMIFKTNVLLLNSRADQLMLYMQDAEILQVHLTVTNICYLQVQLSPL